MNRNKRYLLAILVFVLCVAFAAALVACKPTTTTPPKLEVSFDGTHEVYEGDTLDSLKPYLTVKYTNDKGETTQVSNYTLAGTLSKGRCAVVVSYSGLEKSFMVTVREKQVATYTVTFKADGVTVGTRTYTADNKNISEPSVPSKTGYVGKWENYELSNSDLTVNAVYTAKTYTLNLDYNGATGGNTQQSVTVTYDKNVGTLPTPTKTDYEFLGWYLGEEEITSETVWKVDSDTQLTLVAEWESKGIFDNVYTVDEAVALANTLASNQCTDEQIYVIGIVSTEPSIGSEGDYLFHITDENQRAGLYIYYASCNIIGVDSLKVGDIVVVYGYLCNYNGNTPEMKKNNNIKPEIVWVYSDEMPNVEKGTFDNPYTASEALEITSALADNAYSESPVYVKGTITGTVTEGSTAGDFKFTITDDSGDIFTIYYASLPSSVASKIEASDTVIVYGYLYKYVSSYGSTPEMKDYNGVDCKIVSVVKANVPNDGEVTLTINKNFIEVNDYVNLTITPYDYDTLELVFLSGQECVTRIGLSLRGESKGTVVIQVLVDGNLSNTVELQIVDPADDPYTNTVSNWFYNNYNEATSLEDAYWRTKHNLMSGSIADQDQKPTEASNRPKSGNKFVRNVDTYFIDNGNTYEVVDSRGNVVNQIYKFGAYVSLEDVAAYVYAFGDVPANYSSNKDTSPASSDWGKWLRLNNSYYSGDTDSYPYEPVMPRIDGVYFSGEYFDGVYTSGNGDLKYYEIDIGTTGTDCDPRYDSVLYNDGNSITRGAARIVYTRYYTNGEVITDLKDRYVFYTYNHYNDFQEYLNYQGGWGQMFGNITGGGSISSRSDYNPTPYVEVVRQHFSQLF